MSIARRVLVSGASGLIGFAVVQALENNEYKIVRLVRRPPSSANEIQWDPSQPLRPESVSSFDAVVHLAGESIVGRWTADKRRKIRESRVIGTRHLAEGLARTIAPPRVFVTASAIGYYGDRGDEVLREGSSAGSGFLPEVCVEWEAASQPAADAGIRCAHLRLGIVLSAQGGALAKMLRPFRLGIGGKVGSGRQWWSWISLRDVASAFVQVLNTEELRGPVNAVSPNSVTNEEFTKVLGSVLSRPTIFPIPAFAARLAFGQMADELLLASQRVEPAKLITSAFAFQHPILQEALTSVLGK